MDILNRTLGKDILPPLLVTFGLSVIMQNGLLELFTADSRKLNAGALETGSFPLLPGVDIGYLPLLQFVVAIARHRRAAIPVLQHGTWPRLPRHLG